jgi:hypothetical protein
MALYEDGKPTILNVAIELHSNGGFRCMEYKIRRYEK